MKRQLVACLNTHLKFSWRNRVPLAFAGLLLGLMLLTVLPMVLLMKSVDRLDLLIQTVRYLQRWIYVVIAALALISVSHHLQNRSLKMVISKPCPIEVWLLSPFLSVAAIAACLYAVVLTLAVGLALLWRIPIHPGLFFVTCNEFLRAMIISSYLILLASLFHPVIAAMVVLMMQEDQFYWLTILISKGLEATPDSPWRGWFLAATQISQAIYRTLPWYEPFARQTAHIHFGSPIGWGNLKYLAYTAVYTACFASFCFLISDWILRKRRHT